MPRNRQRTTNKGQWTKEDLENARRSIRDGKSSIREASKKFGIPFATLQRRMKTDAENVTSGPAMGRKAVLSPEQEKVMVESIKLLGKLFYGLNCQQIRYVAYEFADRQGIIHSFNKEKKCAGRDWLEGFLKRNPTVVTRKPEPPSSNNGRVAAFNKTDISLFFDNLESMMQQHYFSPDRIYAVDETVITTILELGTLAIPGVLVEKEQKKGNENGSATANEDRGKNLTVVCSMNAVGNFIPPMFIFPRQRISQQLAVGGPMNAIYHCTKDGSVSSNLFLTWLGHFKEHSKVTAETPCLLILDNHLSHVSLKIYEYCNRHNIILLPIPPHTSHRMQPMNVAFYGPLKKAFRKECDMFMSSQGLKNITQNDLAKIFNKAYTSVADIQKATAGFRVTGIVPIYRRIFTNEDFLSSKALQSPAVQSTSSVKSEIMSPDSPTSIDHFLYNIADQVDELKPRLKQESSAQDIKTLCDTSVEQNHFMPFPHSSTQDPIVY